MSKATQSNRRSFLQQSAAVGVGFWVAGGVTAKESSSPNSKLQIAGIGAGGKGSSDVKNASRFGKIYALCDADRKTLASADKLYKTGRTFTDFRELLDQLGDKIDVVTVSTPDHNHAVIASKAMKMGKHCYCQKPMTHSIWEARQLGSIAREMGVATQMGNQFTAYEPMREAAYQIRAGQLGTVKEVHVWTNRPVWPQGEARNPSKPVPEYLDWEAWIGPAPMRDYAEGYHTFKWRGYWDFGTGALGDMACHTCNLPFMALNMRDPTAVEAATSGHNRDSYPAWSKIKYDFPELDGRAAFTMHWYDGTKLPESHLYEEFLQGTDKEGNPLKLDASGVLIIGDKGTMYAAGDYADRGIYLSKGLEPLAVDYPKPPPLGHVQEFYQSIHDRSKPAVSNFPDYAGPLTETILLGNLAVWKGGRVEWDAKKLQPISDPKLANIVRREYRDGYVV